jgi:hypothetical protein
MLYACLYIICFVFCYTSWRFYAFYRTNLSTRCHSASSLFLQFLCFRKDTQEIFSELDETKARIPIFSRYETKFEDETEGHQRATAPWHGAGHPLEAPWLGVGPWPTSWCCPSAYIIPSMGKPKGTDQFSTKPTASRRRRQREIGRVQKLFLAPYRRGESPPEAFFITTAASGVMCE